MKTALTIAGSDSGGGAGMQADLKTFAAYNVYGVCAVTAITAQNTVGVTAVHTVPADLVVAQMEAVASDIGVDAAKTGMLLNAAIVEAVAASVGALEIPFLVVDPVMVAKSGDRLLQDDAVAMIKTELLRRAYVVTPNRPEAEVLAGHTISSTSTARDAARRIHDFGPVAVILTGGHAPGDDVVDILFDGRDFLEFRGPRIYSTRTHGTGCTFGAAVAASLALGRSLTDATQSAKSYVEQGIRQGIPIGQGHGPAQPFLG